MAWTVALIGVDLITATWNAGEQDQFSVSAPLYAKEAFPIAEFVKAAVGKRDEQVAKVAAINEKASAIVAAIEAALNASSQSLKV